MYYFSNLIVKERQPSVNGGTRSCLLILTADDKRKNEIQNLI